MLTRWYVCGGKEIDTFLNELGASYGMQYGQKQDTELLMANLDYLVVAVI